MELPKVLTTEEFSDTFHCSPKTVRKNYSETGHCFGVIPLKIGVRLLWKASDISKLLNGEEGSDKVPVMDLSNELTKELLKKNLQLTKKYIARKG